MIPDAISHQCANCLNWAITARINIVSKKKKSVKVGKDCKTKQLRWWRRHWKFLVTTAVALIASGWSIHFFTIKTTGGSTVCQIGGANTYIENLSSMSIENLDTNVVCNIFHGLLDSVINSNLYVVVTNVDMTSSSRQDTDIQRESKVNEVRVEKSKSGLTKYDIEDRFPAGRIFTYHYVTNKDNSRITVSIVRASSCSKPHDGPDHWGVISNSIEFSSCVSNARDMYAHGRYYDALRTSEIATNILGNIIEKSPYTNFIFDWALINDMTCVAEIMAEKLISDGKYSEAKKIMKSCIREYPIAPSRAAAIYFVADRLSEERDHFSICNVKLSISNGVSHIDSSRAISYSRWENSFEFDAKEVNKQLALWGYIYPLLYLDKGDEFFVVKYSEYMDIPDSLPYPSLYQKWWWGDYYGKRWVGFGRYEEYNVSESLRKCSKTSGRLIRDGVVR